jgi:hypothetical protein
MSALPRTTAPPVAAPRRGGRLAPLAAAAAALAAAALALGPGAATP